MDLWNYINNNLFIVTERTYLSFLDEFHKYGSYLNVKIENEHDAKTLDIFFKTFDLCASRNSQKYIVDFYEKCKIHNYLMIKVSNEFYVENIMSYDEFQNSIKNEKIRNVIDDISKTIKEDYYA